MLEFNKISVHFLLTHFPLHWYRCSAFVQLTYYVVDDMPQHDKRVKFKWQPKFELISTSFWGRIFKANCNGLTVISNCILQGYIDLQIKLTLNLYAKAVELPMCSSLLNCTREINNANILISSIKDINKIKDKTLNHTTCVSLLDM